MIHNDIKTADGEFDIFQNITVADVQRVARTYFRPENRLVLTVMPSGKGRRAMNAREPQRRAACRPSFALACVASAAAQTRPWPTERPPQPLPAREIKFPPYEIQTLPNGLQVVAVLHHEQPAVTMRLLVRSGHVVGSERQARAGAPGGLAARSGHDDQVGASR